MKYGIEVMNTREWVENSEKVIDRTLEWQRAILVREAKEEASRGLREQFERARKEAGWPYKKVIDIKMNGRTYHSIKDTMKSWSDVSFTGRRELIKQGYIGDMFGGYETAIRIDKGLPDGIIVAVPEEKKADDTPR